MKIAFPQEYSFPLYFEDAVGNKDTLIFGFDQSATFGIDNQFGEKNLINEPLDSIFEVFFTDAATGKAYDSASDDCYLKTPQTPTYISKKQYNDFYDLYGWMELGMIAKNWPVTISWNQNEMESYVSDQGNSWGNMFIYSWNPPESLIGDVHCCGEWPSYFTIMNDTSRVLVEKNNFCHYASTISNDSINLFFINYSSFTGIKEVFKENVRFQYSSEDNSISCLNSGELRSGTFEIYDLSGRVRMKKFVNNLTGKVLKIDVGTLPKGIYIIRVYSDDSHPYFVTQKLQIP